MSCITVGSHRAACHVIEMQREGGRVELQMADVEAVVMAVHGRRTATTFHPLHESEDVQTLANAELKA